MPSAEYRAGRLGWPGRLGRVQRGDRLQLRLHNLYILPTAFGVLWLGGAGLLQVVGIQTQRNGPLLLSFLMLTLQLLALHLTHFNLQGLELCCGRSEPGFTGEPLVYPLLARSRHARNAIQLRLAGQEASSEATQPRRIPAGTSILELSWRCEQRGLQAPGLLLISSAAPQGLFVCWSRWWLSFDRTRQEALLEWLLGGRRWALGLVILVGLALGLLGALVPWQLRRPRPRRDRIDRDLAELLCQLRRLGLEPRRGETLEDLCQRAGAIDPRLAAPLLQLARCHDQRRFAAADPQGASARQAADSWRRSLRQLKQARGSAIRQEN